MSWSANNPDIDVDVIDEFPLKPEHFSFSPPYTALHEEPKLQALHAIEVVQSLLEEGLLGEGVRVNCSLSGHANPEFESHPASNPTPNTLNIYLTSKMPAVEEPDA
jgi:hypothetical protein